MVNQYKCVSSRHTLAAKENRGSGSCAGSRQFTVQIQTPCLLGSTRRDISRNTAIKLAPLTNGRCISRGRAFPAAWKSWASCCRQNDIRYASFDLGLLQPYSIRASSYFWQPFLACSISAAWTVTQTAVAIVDIRKAWRLVLPGRESTYFRFTSRASGIYVQKKAAQTTILEF